MVLAPPGSAKTTYVSQIFIAWLLTRKNTKVIAVSHTVELAESNSRAVQRIIRDHSEVLGITLLNDNVSHWYTSNGCEYRCVGSGTAVRGARADYIVVDDPIRSRQDAEIGNRPRNSVGILPLRSDEPAHPSGAVIMIATPFHENDLMCRLLREQADALARAADAGHRRSRRPARPHGRRTALGR